jgi:flagellar motor switch protein FliN/FliY
LLEPSLQWLAEALGGDLSLGSVDLLDRAAGIQRPGVIATWQWASRGTSVGLHLENRLAHALVDRLLGFDRPIGAERLQVSPVEWGIITHVADRFTGEMASRLTPAGSLPDLVLDRVGPDPFRPEPGRGYETLVVPVRIGPTTGLVRLWLPVGALETIGGPSEEDLGSTSEPVDLLRYGLLVAVFYAQCGEAQFPKGLGRVRAGGVVPLVGRTLTGTPREPSGSIVLATRPDQSGWVSEVTATLVPKGAGASARILGPLRRRRMDSSRGEGRVMPENPPQAEWPVTLTVELGRVGLSLEQMADLKPGDILNLARHSREPVELTSGGRLVACGELLLIDTELGVRITTVLL